MAPLPLKPLLLNVRRQDPELITPSKPTPHEFKPLSDIDDQEGLRVQSINIQLYRHVPSMKGKDPVCVIREALAKTLVYYYPFSGRLREGSNRKLIVECTGEGVMFIEADAEPTLEEFFGEAPKLPLPCVDELLFDVPGSSGILNCPLLLIQVTRFRCDGFIFALRFNHTMSDGAGITQFLTAVGEIAQGAGAPSVRPTWERHILTARDPPRVTHVHHEYDDFPLSQDTEDQEIGIMTNRSFFFGAAQMSAIRKLIPLHHHAGHKFTSFEVLTACLLKCRTIALQPDPNQDVRLICMVNARKRVTPPFPAGYYGNCIAYSTVVASAGKIMNNPIGYSLELVREAKANVTAEYMKSMVDFLVVKGRPPCTFDRSYLVSDLTRLKYSEEEEEEGGVDFGWGKAIYSGPPEGGETIYHVSFKNKEGEDGILVILSLPALAMERFENELNKVMEDDQATEYY